MRRLLLLSFALFFTLSGAQAQNSKKLPRFASLKTNEINVRVGPGEHFPVRFSFHRQFWPVKITYEFEDWRKIIDQKGNEGWVHRRTLCGKTYVVILQKTRLLKNDEPSSPPAARIEKDVHVLLKKCEKGSCKVEAKFHGKTIKGWVPQKLLWGVPDDDKK